MLLWEIFIVALQAIRANVLRSVLTALGIVIGIGAVITMVSLGAGAQQRVEAEIDKRGANVLNIRGQERRRGGVSQGEKPLTTADAEALKSEAGHYLAVNPMAWANHQITFSRSNTNKTIIGTWPDHVPVQNYHPFVGRFFDEGEVQSRRRVAVLGWNIPKELKMAGVLLLGRTIQIRGIPFKVVGVMEEKGNMGGRYRPDDYVYVPLSTAQFRLFGGWGRENIGALAVQASGAELVDQALVDVDRIIRRQHRTNPGSDPDFRISGSTDWLDAQQETNKTFTYLLMGIAAVSLLVGGIGIMNIMMVSVTERTREIGVRKAMGATRGAILFQFLMEALVLCILGGIIGLASGVGGSVFLANSAGWDAVVEPNAVVVAIAFSGLMGLFFGIWPAHRAARLDPIEALRYE